MDPAHELEEDEGRGYCVRVPYDVVRTVQTLMVSALSGADATQRRDLKRFQEALELSTVEQLAVAR